MVMFVDVTFPISSYKTFVYKIPKSLINGVQVGIRVRVPFRNSVALGFVTNIKKSTHYQGEIKAIIEIVDKKPIFSQKLWKLVLWMSNYYLAPKGQVAKLVLPSSINTEYSPKKIWYVKKKSDEDYNHLKKSAPKQYLLQNMIVKSKKSIQVEMLKGLVSNPLIVCKSLQKKGFVSLFKKDSLEDIKDFSFPILQKKINFNSDQKRALKKINTSISGKKFNSYLLHGVTGSGKTEIYIGTAQHCLEKGLKAIILLPEISLTPQISGRFKSVFGSKVALWHSKLSTSQKNKTLQKILSGSTKVVIGARSAIFSPMSSLGLIVVDEEQESSFYQESPSPYYHARDVALMRGKIENATIVLSSATPSLESYYNYLKGKIKYINLPKRYGSARYPKVHVIDMNSEKEDSGKFGTIFSGLLQDKIEERLLKKEQIIILHNRRGHSPVIKCLDCGSILMCPKCKVFLTYHNQGEKIICHFCGYSVIQKLDQCFDCGSDKILYSGTGTQRAEELLVDMFPSAKIKRLDMDTSKKGAAILKILKQFSDGNIDILLGTQMIAKGLDFPNATLVGIINADIGLHLPDFRSSERIFQLIYQASGRAGRKDKLGEVVLQTYMPDNPVIKFVSELDIKNFYTSILNEREELNYPPYSWLAKIEFSSHDLNSIKKITTCFSSSIIGSYKGLDILGPAPCYLEKLKNSYRFQVIFKSNKIIDPNGYLLHKFIINNIKKLKTDFGSTGYKAKIFFDPLSLI